MDEAAAIPTVASLAIAALDNPGPARGRFERRSRRHAAARRKEFRRGQLYQELAETELARAECAILAGNLTAARGSRDRHGPDSPAAVMTAGAESPS